MTTLTPEQQEPVDRRDEPVFLSAPAGSGKTTVLVERFVRAVCDDGVAPARVLAITFTERAAGELRERVRERLLELGERDAARDSETAFVSTFHGFCARLLRTHPALVALDPHFTIFDESLAGRLRRRAFAQALREFVAGRRASAVDMLAAYGVDRVRVMVEGVYAELRSGGERRPRLPRVSLDGHRASGEGEQLELDDPVADAERRRLDAEAAQTCELLDELLAGFGHAYERLKRERGGVDFDDLELHARDLLVDERIRREWSERFVLLMVDEFQDTNPRQLQILQALDRGNLFTVGDEHQSIYRFRHADVTLFRQRRAALQERGATLSLTENFRSRPSLLAVINAVFTQRFVPFVPLRAVRPEVAMEASAPSQAASPAAPARAPASVGTQLRLIEPPAMGEADYAGAPDPTGAAEPTVELLLTDTGGWERDEQVASELADGLPRAPLWRQAEARLLAQRVAELVGDGRVDAGEVAVLLRALGDLEVYERALRMCGLRTVASAGGFWGRQQVVDLLAYLRVIANPLDDLAIYETLASSLVGCSTDCVALLAHAARARGGSAWEATAGLDADDPALSRLKSVDRDALSHFRAHLQRERESAGRRSLAALIVRAVEVFGYERHVLSLDGPERRMANVNKLVRLARRFEASEGRELRGFLDHVAHLRDSGLGPEPDAPVEGIDPDAVRLMSVHAAKGLEFEVVCIADLGRSPYVRMPDLVVADGRVGLRLARLDSGASVPALDYRALCDERAIAEGAEEDRIAYVAMTRARERLVLSGAIDLKRWSTGSSGSAPIWWLAHALEDAGVHPLVSTVAGVGSVLRLPASPRPARVRQLTSPTPVVSKAGGENGWPSELNPGAAVSEWTATLSYSSLSELERCGYRFYLERVLGLTETRPPSGYTDGAQARARGVLVHRLLEQTDFSSASPPSVARVGEVARELGVRIAEHEREELVALLAAALAAPLAARVAAATEVRRELPFSFVLGSETHPPGPLVSGVIDLLARETDAHPPELLVLDYKSDHVADGAVLETLVEHDYGAQRLLYALAALRDGAGAVEVVHWFLQRPHEPVVARYSGGERETLEARLEERVEHARGAGFTVSSRPHRGLCLTCPGRGGLCSWGDTETLRLDPLP